MSIDNFKDEVIFLTKRIMEKQNQCSSHETYSNSCKNANKYVRKIIKN